jgi:hypothetical protein
VYCTPLFFFSFSFSAIPTVSQATLGEMKLRKIEVATQQQRYGGTCIVCFVCGCNCASAVAVAVPAVSLPVAPPPHAPPMRRAPPPHAPPMQRAPLSCHRCSDGYSSFSRMTLPSFQNLLLFRRHLAGLLVGRRHLRWQWV